MHLYIVKIPRPLEGTMFLFLILAPFVTFATVMMLTTVKASIVAAAAVGAGVVGWDLVRGRSLKILSMGALVLFAGLCLYHAIAKDELNPTTVRLIVDIGVLALSLASIAVRKPFTIQYALERVDAETGTKPRFIRVNYILTWVWSAAFVLMLLADILSIYLPSMPLWMCAAIAFAARNTATYFTQWYPKHVRAAVQAAAARQTAA